jgi:hypothetical protein
VRGQLTPDGSTVFEEHDTHAAVIASEAKQSIVPPARSMDCFVAALVAMTAEV